MKITKEDLARYLSRCWAMGKNGVTLGEFNIKAKEFVEEILKNESNNN